MKNVLLAIMISVGLLTSSLVQANDKDLSIQLKEFDKTVLSKENSKFKLTLQDLLSPEEKTYKNNIIMFMIDDIPYMYTFDLYVKLSNNGIEQKAILFIPKGLLVKITESNKTVVKVGGNKDTEFDNNSKDKIRDMLFKII